jgi:L-lysine exporter family protein LysE/ArgO
MTNAFFYGILLALGLIVPLGVQNIFIFQQGALQKRFHYAFPSILTAFICDAILILCAVLGVSMIVFTLPLLKNIIYIGGFFFLCYMGWLTWRSSPSVRNNSAPLSAKAQVGFAMSVSLLNPHALIDSIGVIGTNALMFNGSEKWIFTLACISVSFFWFLALAITGRIFYQFDKTGFGMLFLNKISALIIWSVAVYIAFQLL